MKKILFIGLGGAVIIAAAVAAIIYFGGSASEITKNGPLGVFRALNIFGGGEGTTEPQPDIPFDNNQESPLIQSQDGLLVKISEEPTIGHVAFTRTIEEEIPAEDGTTEIVEKQENALRYMKKEGGQVFEFLPETNERAALTTTFIENTDKAVWIDTDTLALTSFTNDIRSLQLAEITFGENNVGKIEIEYLESTAKEVTASQGGIYYVSYEGDVGTSVRRFENNESSIAMSSPHRGWNLHPTYAGLLASPYASSEVEGSLFRAEGSKLFQLIPKTESFLALPNLEGKTALTLSQSSQTGTVFSVATLGTAEKTPLDILTLPEKCTWVSEVQALCAVPGRIIYENDLPDSWYQGREDFSDGIWQVNTETGASYFLYAASQEAGENIDAVDLEWNNEHHMLYFRNNVSGSLWGLNLDGFLVE